jgi:hypothetical protein
MKTVIIFGAILILFMAIYLIIDIGRKYYDW